MGSALVVHDEVLRTAIESHGGCLFSHTGDGVVAAFASPKAAVDTAVAAQQRLELPVRMGLATGEAELRDGDYFGTVLNRAARVMAAGNGGQILLADSTAGLLNGVELANLGRRRLRDLPIPITIFQLHAPGLRTDFPPLRTLEVNPGNLRPAATSLVGREAEVTEIEAQLRSHRLVTLTGVGGVGKTRLATEVAMRMVDGFPDGAWVFELATVADPEAVPDAVAAVLGITQQPGKTVSESVAVTLEGRVRLLVFDNCEHVLDAAADLVEAILAQSATVTILATSREGLGVAREQIWPVKSLTASAAVELLVERAHNVAPGFSADDTVLEICHRLDRIPLAIELAASRMASMTATEVRDRLDHRFKLLIGSRRGLERHQTLRHAVQWSYDLLDDAERTLLDRCSVFAGGFDVESSCAVAGSDGADEYVTLDLLDALVRKSLLVADRTAGRTRYSMLETIRQFAEDQLVARGEATEVRTAHARYFAGREADIMSLWDSPRQREAYDWFAIELPNLRTAFRWAADQGDFDVAAPIATCAAWLGFLTENYEPIAWAEDLIEPARTVDHPRLAALYSLTSLCYNTGRIDSAIRYTEAAERAISGASVQLPHTAAGFLGSAYPAVGQPERWVQWFRAQLARGRYTDPYSRTNVVIGLTVAGSIDDAMAAAGGLIEAAEATGNPYVLSWALVAHGYAFRASDPGLALAAARRGLAIARDSGNRFNETMLVHMLSGLEAEHGDRMAALDYFTVSIGNFHESGNTYMVSAPLALLAVLLDRLGRHESAATIAGFAAANPMTTAALPEIGSAIVHLCDVLGRARYESFACTGAGMTNTAIVAYAYDQIDQARAALADAPN